MSWLSGLSHLFGEVGDTAQELAPIAGPILSAYPPTAPIGAAITAGQMAGQIPSLGQEDTPTWQKILDAMNPGASGFGSLLTGGAQAYNAFHQPKPQQQPQYYNPMATALQQRALAIVDKYLKEKGIDALIPPERMPYELRPPEQRQAIASYIKEHPKAANVNNSDYNSITFWPTPTGISTDGPYAPPSAVPAAPQVPQTAAPNAQAFMPRDPNILPSGANEVQFQDQARRLNLAPTQPMLDTPTPTFDAQRLQQQEQLKKIYDFIYKNNKNRLI